MAGGKGQAAQQANTQTASNVDKIREMRNNHIRANEMFSSQFETKNKKVEAYKADSKKEINAYDLTGVWQNYTAFRDSTIKEEQEMISSGLLTKMEQDAVKEDIESFKKYEEKEEVKKFKEYMSLVPNIEKSNTRVKGLLEETDQERAAGEGLVTDYEQMVVKYQDDGNLYPEPKMLERAKEHGKKVQKNQILLEHKMTNQKSKSKDISVDIREQYMGKAGKQGKKSEYIKSADKLINAVANHKDTMDTMLKYKRGNEELEREYTKIKSIYDAGKEAEDGFNEKTVALQETVGGKVVEKEIMTKRKQKQFDKINQTAGSLQSESKGMDELSSKISKGELMVSVKKKQQWNELRTNTLTFESRSKADVKTRHALLSANSREMVSANKGKKGDNENVSKIKTLCGTLRRNLLTEIGKYTNSTRKISLEHQGMRGTGTIANIESMYEEYETLIPAIHSSLDPKEVTEVITKYEEFQKEREVPKVMYRKVAPYIGSKPSRKMIVRLIRRAKMIKNAKDGELFSSDYDGGASTWLNRLEKAEDFPKTMAKKGLSAMGMKNEQAQSTTVGVTKYLGGEALNDPNQVFNFIEDHAVASGAKEEKEGLFNYDTSDATERYGLAMNIMGTATAAFDLLKEILAAVKEWGGGTDGREVGKRLLSMCDQAMDLFESISGFFHLKVPILSTIKSALKIVIKIVDLTRSYKSRAGISGKKKEIREKVRNGADKRNYDLKSNEIKKAAVDSGYDTRGTDVLKFWKRWNPSTAARMHAEEKRQEQQHLHAYGSAYANLTDDANEQQKRKDEVAKGGEASRDAITGNMHTRMHQLRAKGQGKIENLSQKEQDEFHSLERISTMHEYDILTESNVRMKNKTKDDWKDIIEEGWSIVSSFLKVTPSPAAVGAVITDIALAVADSAHDLVAKGAGIVREATDNMYSKKNKGIRRSKMAANFYDRMIVASNILDSSGQVDIENHDDWEIDEAAQHMNVLYFDLAKGLDAYISHIIECKTKDEMIEQMSSAFSVDGN